MEQRAVQSLLQQRLAEAQTKNPSYSLRSFAMKLGIGAGPLSQILAGTRKVSPKMAERFFDALLLDPTERKKVLNPPTLDDGVDHEETERLSADRFQLISEWYYFGILSLLQTRGFKNDPVWIARRLGIRQSQAEQAVARLLRLGMVEEAPQQKLKRCKPRYGTTDDVTSLPVRKAHFQTLELAKASLEKDPVELRDFTAMTIPTHLERLPEAKVMIRKFQQELCNFMMATETKTEVYKLSVELFPLTQIQKELK